MSDRAANLRQVLIRAARRPKTAHNEPIPESTEWTFEADDYDAGKAQIDADVPEGWVLVWVRVEG